MALNLWHAEAEIYISYVNFAVYEANSSASIYNVLFVHKSFHLILSSHNFKSTISAYNLFYLSTFTSNWPFHCILCLSHVSFVLFSVLFPFWYPVCFHSLCVAKQSKSNAFKSTYNVSVFTLFITSSFQNIFHLVFKRN